MAITKFTSGREATSVERYTVNRLDVLVVMGLFAASQVLYALLGLRFDASTFPGYMQFIDIELLSNRLLESLWYYHANPPMLNLFAGMAQKMFGDNAGWFFSVSFHVLGLLVALCVYALVLKLRSGRTAACVATGLLVFSPAFVLYENWLMYTFPAMAMLTVSALTLYQYVQTLQTKWCVAFFGMLAALLLTRSLFHIAWMVLIAVLLVALLWDRRRQVMLAAIVPVLVVALWYGKNCYYFGTFSGSTWMGLGLSNITTLVVPRNELAPLVLEQKLSPYALVSRYENVATLFASREAKPTGIPVLDQVRKSTGEYNFNNAHLIEINGYYAADSLEVIRHFPASYVHGLMISNRLFFSPTNMNLYFSPTNRDAVRPMEWLFNPLLYGAKPTSGFIEQPHFGFTGRYRIEVNTGVPLIVLWWIVLGYGYAQARKGILSKEPDLKPRAIVIGFIVVTALYLYVVGTALELAENYRYRFLIEPLFMVLAVTTVADVVRRTRNVREAITTESSKVASGCDAIRSDK